MKLAQTFILFTTFLLLLSTSAFMAKYFVIEMHYCSFFKQKQNWGLRFWYLSIRPEEIPKQTFKVIYQDMFINLEYNYFIFYCIF